MLNVDQIKPGFLATYYGFPIVFMEYPSFREIPAIKKTRVILKFFHFTENCVKETELDYDFPGFIGDTFKLV